jgi:hypothetical protein
VAIANPIALAKSLSAEESPSGMRFQIKWRQIIRGAGNANKSIPRIAMILSTSGK